MSNTRVVFSTDPKDKIKCEKCRQFMDECKCPPKIEIKSRNFVAVLRIEKSGRGGKTVTVIDQLPKLEPFLKDLCTELKKKCGVGGTYLMDRKEGVIEIQGDKRAQIRSLLEAKDFKVKG